MIPPIQKQILEKLGCLCESSAGVRFGQLMANLAFLAEDATDRTLWDLEDEDLLRLIEKHRAEMSSRQPKPA
jgi:hypothetical protein